MEIDDFPGKWGALVEGTDDIRLEWADLLKPPSDPWIEIHQSGANQFYVLRSKCLDNLNSLAEAKPAVAELFQRSFGALLLARGVRHATFRFAAKVTDDGRVLYSIDFDFNTPMGPPALTLNTDPSDLQRWLGAAEVDEDLDDLFIYLARANNWFDLYKGMETVEKIAGGLQELIKIIGSDAAPYRNARWTANTNRHAGKKSRPPAPATMFEARDILLAACNQVILLKYPPSGP